MSNDIRVLHHEDDPNDRALVRRALKKAGVNRVITERK